MSQLDQTINYTKLNQDVELATAIAALKNDPVKLADFMQKQQNKVYQTIVKQKEDTFEKVYGDLDRSTHVQEAVIMYNKRTQDLAAIQKQIYENQKNSADAVSQDKQNSSRKSEMNEWSVQNKKDTLFVFSSLFLMLSGLLLLTVLWRMSLISSTLWVALGAPLILIFIFIVVNRSQYTDKLRNKRSWNKQIFEGKYGKIPIPLCPNMMEGIQNAEASLLKGANAARQMAAQGAAGAASTAGQALTSFSTSIQ